MQTPGCDVTRKESRAYGVEAFILDLRCLNQMSACGFGTADAFRIVRFRVTTHLSREQADAYIAEANRRLLVDASAGLWVACWFAPRPHRA